MDSNDKYSGAKYIVEARFTIDGVVEKHDVIGAIFGQTEGLFPSEFELRELQKSGKIGRIDIDLKSAKDKTSGKIILPSSLDRAETAIIAAAMETVDRVGPCDARITIEEIADVRSDKRQRIVKRAKELMRNWVVKETQDIDKLLEEVSEEDRRIQPVHYGRERLTATPDISKSDEVIVVEGRADVINLIKSGMSGVIALEGVKIPDTIKNLVKRKEVTAFLDGDRGGDLILKELTQVAKPDYIARAPRGREVEDLSPQEVKESLSNKVPFDEIAVEMEFSSLAEELQGTLEGVLMTSNGQRKDRVPVSELVEKVKQSKDIDILVFDGIITGRLIDAAKEAGLHTIIGARVAEGVRIPRDIDVKSFEDLE
ncbi:MAG: DNA primase DnaG [Candidatus Bathyarchaeia archaeon]